jgi:hypothetical protein
MSQVDVLRKLGERASDQWGLVTAAQAKLDGIQGVHLLRLERAGLLENVGRGIYRITASAPPEHLETKVAWLRLDPKTPAWQRSGAQKWAGVVSHASACELHRLGDLPSDRVELIVPVRRTTRDETVLLHRLPLEANDVTVVDGLPVTTAERTITDLLRSRADGAHIGTVIADADLRGLIDVDRLADRVVPFVRGYGLPAAASGEELLQALCQQAGRSLRRHETEQAAAAGFASALSALEELAAPAALEKILRDAAARQSVLQGQSAVEKVLQRVGSMPLEKILRDAAARPSRQASSGLGQALKGMGVWRPVSEQTTSRPRALERAEHDEEEAG